MAVSLPKKTIKGYPYWYARECQRVNGKPTIVWQKYLGKADAIAAAMGAPARPPAPKEIRQLSSEMRQSTSEICEQLS